MECREVNIVYGVQATNAVTFELMPAKVKPYLAVVIPQSITEYIKRNLRGLNEYIDDKKGIVSAIKFLREWHCETYQNNLSLYDAKQIVDALYKQAMAEINT